MLDVDSEAILTQAVQEYLARTDQGEAMLVTPASQVFLQEVFKPAPAAILKTSAKKAPTRQANEAPTVRLAAGLP
jgi:hypothetical protein